MLPNLKYSKDYLIEPKDSGYRGLHLIFEHDKMSVDIQLRTRLQHLWATSVETIDVICNTSMKTTKTSSYWQRFFELASSAFAYMEKLPILPQHQGWDVIRLRDEMRNIMNEHPIENKLKTYAATFNIFNSVRPSKDSYYAVVTYNSRTNKTSILYYPENSYQDALLKYEELETDSCDNNVLVSVSDLKKLHDVYPNYFKDISKFKEMITAMLGYKPKMSYNNNKY